MGSTPPCRGSCAARERRRPRVHAHFSVEEILVHRYLAFAFLAATFVARAARAFVTGAACCGVPLVTSGAFVAAFAPGRFTSPKVKNPFALHPRISHAIRESDL